MSEKIEKKYFGLKKEKYEKLWGFLALTFIFSSGVAISMGWIDSPLKNKTKNDNQERKLTADEISKLQNQNRKMFEWLSGVCNSFADNERNSDCQEFLKKRDQFRPDKKSARMQSKAR